MAYLEQVVSSRAGAGGAVIANTWPAWEITTPQYPTPNPYGLAQAGYRRNEIVFACIQKRLSAVGEAPTQVLRGKGKEKAVDERHPYHALIHRPNEAMGEVEFWQAVQVYLDVAGFSVWEIEFNRLGQPLHLWPLRPDWCSFLRGEHRPLRAVRYQPWGLTHVDIPIERCVVFMEFDPLFPMLKGLSRSMIAMRSFAVDNSATDFLKNFFDNGAVINGLLKTQQALNETEAMRIRQLWKAQHGGIQNWGDPAVLGSGVDYQAMQMNFRDMAFEQIDGREEARICATFEVPPILIGAKIGLERATYSNYAEARKAFYEETVTPRWRWLQSEMTQQLLPHWEADTAAGDVVVEFDRSEVTALQEDRDAKVKRADQMFKGGWASRDEARAEVGLDPVDAAVPVFAVAPASTAVGTEIEQEAEEKAEAQAAQLAAMQAQPNAPAEGEAEAEDEPEAELDAAETKKVLGEWRKAELARRAGQSADIPAGVARLPAALVRAITAGLTDPKTPVRAVFAKNWPVNVTPEPTLAEVLAELRAARLAAEKVAA